MPDTEGCFLVPAFTGLGSPWWDPYARGTIVGITRGTGRGHLARAVLESISLQTRDVVLAMSEASGHPIRALKADGGAAANDLLLQLQADDLQVPVSRPVVQETTALGAAYLAGLAEGVWSSPADITANWRLDATFEPQADPTRPAAPPRRVAPRRRALAWLGRRRLASSRLPARAWRTPPAGWRQATIVMRPSGGPGLGVGVRLPPVGLTYGIGPALLSERRMGDG